MLLAIGNRVSAWQSTVDNKPGNKSRQQVQERNHPAPSTQTIYAPLGIQNSNQAEIVLNNNSPGNMDVAPAFYTNEGIVTGKIITLKPAQVRNMAIGDLMPVDHPLNNPTGMTLTYFGGMLEVGGQITLPTEEREGSVDITFSAAMDYRSSVQEAVWWMPRNGRATIILGNASDARIVAGLRYSNGETQDIQLDAFSTGIVERAGDGKDNSFEGTAQSVRLEVSGPIGSLRATGFVTSPATQFSSSVRFYDPATIRQPHLFATNLRLEKKEPRLVLKNIGDVTVSARPRFVSVSGESGGVIELPGVSLEPHHEAEVDLKPLSKAANVRSDFNMVSAQIINDSGANNLIGALYSTDLKTKTTYDVPLRDSGPVRNSTGSYPWRLDGDYSTTISITNTRDNASRYLVTINFEGGRYSLSPKEIAANETIVFDLRKIRDEQAPDKDGNTIPRTVIGGQFRWSLIGDDTHRLIGRSEVVSLSKSVSSSYSCPVCCPDSFSGLVITPGSSVGPVGGNALLAVNGFLTDCYFIQHGPYAWSVSSWWIQYPGVISLQMVSQGSAQMGCLSLGSSQFSGTTYETWYDNNGMDCYSHYTPFNDGCCADVVSVSIGDFPGVGKDQTADVQVTLTPSPIQGSITLGLSATSGTGVAKFASNGTTTLNISQTTTVTISGKTESSTAGNMKLEAKAAGQSLGFRTFTVVAVALSLRTGSSNTASMDNAGRATYQNCTGSFSLGTVLVSGTCPNIWSTGVEVVGTVLPSNFTGLIVLHRQLVDKRVYDGSNNLIQSESNQGDDSDPGFRDDDPQSGGSNGKVFDLDAPGVGSVSSDPTGTVRRKRTNYRQWATLGSSGGKVSTSDLLWFMRVSIVKIGASDQLRTDVSGDNTAGVGTTQLTWNLQ